MDKAELLAKAKALEAKEEHLKTYGSDDELKLLEAELKEYRIQRRLEIVRQAVESGKIRNRQAKTALKILEALQEHVGNGQLHSYELGGNPREGTLAEMFVQYLEDLPPGIPEPENVWLGGDPGQELDRRAKKLASELQVDYVTAAKAVLKEDSALERAYLAGTS